MPRHRRPSLTTPQRDEHRANKGIGRAIAKALASTPGLHVIGTTRTVANGEAAQSELAAEGVQLEFRQLDIDSVESIASFVSELGPVDVLVNNAGVDFGQYYEDGLPHADGAAPTLHTNFTNTALLTDAVLPLINKVGGRIVFVASEAGTYGFAEQPPVIRERVEAATREELASLAEEFVTAVTTEKNLDPRKGFETSAGWKSSMGTYGVSKMLLIRYSAPAPRSPSAPQVYSRAF